MTAAFPGPVHLGRGVVVTAATELPEACRGWPRIVVDEAALADPRPLADVLHGHWLRREPVVVKLGVELGRLREPETGAAAPWELDASFEFSRERLAFLVTANNYDVGGAYRVWGPATRAADLGATEGGPADVVLPDGTPAWCDGGPASP